MYDWATRMLLHYFKLPNENYTVIASNNILHIGESKYDLSLNSTEQFYSTESKNSLFMDD